MKRHSTCSDCEHWFSEDEPARASFYTSGAGRGGDGSHFARLPWRRGDGLLREGVEISCRDGIERVAFLETFS